MSYNPNIPQASDLISTSQPQIQTNFSQLDTVFNVDHFTYSSVSNNGKHRKATLVSTAAPVTAGGEVGLFSNTVAAVVDLFMRRESNGTVLSLTGNIISSTGNDGFGGNYQLFQTPWNMKIFTGTTGVFSGTRNLVLSAATFGSTIYTSQSSAADPNPVSTSIDVFPGTSNLRIVTANSVFVRWLIITN